jgi:hypothetical protein
MTVTYLETLNREQRRAVEHGVQTKHGAPGSALLVIAGAGSGKTNTVAHRRVVVPKIHCFAIRHKRSRPVLEGPYATVEMAADAAETAAALLRELVRHAGAVETAAALLRELLRQVKAAERELAE